jgi:hypothetical protein
LRGIDEKLKTIKLYRYLPGNERTRLKRDRLINSIVIMVARHLLQDNITVNHESIMKIVRKRSATDLDDYEAGRFADQINLYCLENRS